MLRARPATLILVVSILIPCHEANAQFANCNIIEMPADGSPRSPAIVDVHEIKRAKPLAHRRDQDALALDAMIAQTPTESALASDSHLRSFCGTTILSTPWPQ
jgi:hypothetical protein